MMASSHVADMCKNAARLVFPKGARMQNPKKIFNTRLESTTVRAIDVHQGEAIDEAALSELMLEAVRLNT